MTITEINTLGDEAVLNQSQLSYDHPTSNGSIIEKGFQEYNNKNYSVAIKILRKAPTYLCLENPELLHIIAFSYKELYKLHKNSSDLSSAIEYFDKYIRVEPKSENGYFQFIESMITLNIFDVIEPKMNTYLLECGETATYSYSKAKYLHAINQPEKAIEVISNALNSSSKKTDGEIAALYSLKSFINQKQNKHIKAIPDLVNALKHSVNELDITYFNSLYSSLKNDVLSAPTKNALADGSVYIAIYFEKLNHYRDAESYFEIALKLTPSNTHALFSYGQLQKNLGNYQKAIELYHAILKIEPNNIITLQDLFVAFFGNKQFEEAESSIKDAYRLNPKNPETNYYYAFLLSNQGKVKEALEKLAVARNTDIQHFKNLVEQLTNTLSNFLPQISTPPSPDPMDTNEKQENAIRYCKEHLPTALDRIFNAHTLKKNSFLHLKKLKIRGSFHIENNPKQRLYHLCDEMSRSVEFSDKPTLYIGDSTTVDDNWWDIEKYIFTYQNSRIKERVNSILNTQDNSDNNEEKLYKLRAEFLKAQTVYLMHDGKERTLRIDIEQQIQTIASKYPLTQKMLRNKDIQTTIEILSAIPKISKDEALLIMKEELHVWLKKIVKRKEHAHQLINIILSKLREIGYSIYGELSNDEIGSMICKANHEKLELFNPYNGIITLDQHLESPLPGQLVIASYDEVMRNANTIDNQEFNLIVSNVSNEKSKAIVELAARKKKNRTLPHIIISTPQPIDNQRILMRAVQIMCPYTKKHDFNENKITRIRTKITALEESEKLFHEQLNSYLTKTLDPESLYITARELFINTLVIRRYCQNLTLSNSNLEMVSPHLFFNRIPVVNQNSEIHSLLNCFEQNLLYSISAYKKKAKQTTEEIDPGAITNALLQIAKSDGSTILAMMKKGVYNISSTISDDHNEDTPSIPSQKNQTIAVKRKMTDTKTRPTKKRKFSSKPTKARFSINIDD